MAIYNFTLFHFALVWMIYLRYLVFVAHLLGRGIMGVGAEPRPPIPEDVHGYRKSLRDNGPLLRRRRDATISNSSVTDWSIISPMLVQDASIFSRLPSIPTIDQATTLYSATSSISVGQTYVITATTSNPMLCNDTVFSALRGGPTNICTASTCSGLYSAGATVCRTSMNSPSVVLLGRLGTYWAPALGSPAYVQLTFPSIPSTSNNFTFTFEIDGRYRPELYGGNPCAKASSSYNCTLCVSAPWDYRIPPGVFLLWSAAGRSRHIITGPYGQLGEAWDAKKYIQTVSVPISDLQLMPGEYPVVTFFTFSQYPAYGEVPVSSKCSVAYSNQGLYPLKDKPLMLTKASWTYNRTVSNFYSPTPAPTALILDNTDWDQISPLIRKKWSIASGLPQIPSVAQAKIWHPDSLYNTSLPFFRYRVSSLLNASLCQNSTALNFIQGGPSHRCTADSCVGPGYVAGVSYCRASFDATSINLRNTLGTYYTPALGTPAWITITLPPVPSRSTAQTVQFTLDGRYRPELYGGNACANASSSYNCSLCIASSLPWDYNTQPGFYVLWSAAGRDKYTITGPYDYSSAWDKKQFTQSLSAPISLNLQPGEYPVVTFFTFSQYPTMGEVKDRKSCSIGQSAASTNSTYNGKPFLLNGVSFMYRSDVVLSTEPPNVHPRLYGPDDVWKSTMVDPFFHAACNIQGVTSPNAGWFGQKGFIDLKSHFDLAARGFLSCSTTKTSNSGAASENSDIGAWSSIQPYFSGIATMPTILQGYRALHLLRRLWACADANNGSYDTCEYNSTETSRLALAFVQKEMTRFSNYTTWTCGPTCGGTDSPTFDLTSSEQVSYYSMLYDVLISRPGLLQQNDAFDISSALRNQIDLFRSVFWSGGWQLWNGNNWTPYLCVAAMEWAVAFWHEDQAVAEEVVQIINNILWLHRRYYTDDGVYAEGVAMYGLMSVNSLITIAALHKSSFGVAPAAIDVAALQKSVNFFLASMGTDASLVEFGDSYRKRGWGDPLAVLDAAIAPTIAHAAPVELVNVPFTSAKFRAFSGNLYGSGGSYTNPWRMRPEVLSFSASPLTELRTPPVNYSQPLGGSVLDVFPLGGYAFFREPLAQAKSSALGQSGLCFSRNTSKEMCIDAALPSLSDNIPYSSVALQARPNTFGHTEVDFGHFIWNAWGSRLISEFGYGTISTSVTEFDMRRYAYLDNNPAGHNTLVIREAFQPGSSDINFSQLNYVVGSMRDLRNSSYPCVELDGSNVYGASRPDGWLDLMKRYTCALQSIPGAFLILDIIKVKVNRTSLTLYGSQYGGPSFAEGLPVHDRLTIDEYFYVETSASITVNNGVATEILPFNKSTLSYGAAKWCDHVDVDIVSPSSSQAILRPACGIGDYRSGDGLGVISGLSVADSDAHFIYDGLVTTVDVWLKPNALKKRRFRFESVKTVGVEGDVRSFLLVPSLLESPFATPYIKQEDCSITFGCAASRSPLLCSCIQYCIDTSLQWVIVFGGEMRHVGVVGRCGLNTDSVIDDIVTMGLRSKILAA
jgi:hypothetical protein